MDKLKETAISKIRFDTRANIGSHLSVGHDFRLRTASLPR